MDGVHGDPQQFHQHGVVGDRCSLLPVKVRRRLMGLEQRGQPEALGRLDRTELLPRGGPCHQFRGDTAVIAAGQGNRLDRIHHRDGGDHGNGAGSQRIDHAVEDILGRQRPGGVVDQHGFGAVEQGVQCRPD